MNTFLISNPKLTDGVASNPVTLNFKLEISNKLISIRERSFLNIYNRFFLKETIYFLYQKIFQRTIFSIFSKNSPNWGDIQFETFRKIFFFVNYNFYPIPRRYLIKGFLVQNQEFSPITTQKTCWKIFSDSFRNQLIRNHDTISIRFTFLTLNSFTFSYPEQYIEKNVNFFFSRINSTAKNQKLNGLIFKFFFSINLLNFAKRSAFNLTSHITDILKVIIINGNLGGQDNFYLKPVNVLLTTLFDLDNYYLILKPLYFLQETEKLSRKGKGKFFYNYNLKLWEASGFNIKLKKKLACFKKRNFFKLLVNFNGIDFLKLSAFKFCNMNFKFFRKRIFFCLKNIIIHKKFNNNEITMKILIGIVLSNIYSGGLFFEKNRFNSHKNKLFSKNPKANCLNKNMKKFPTILIFDRNLVKMSLKKSLIFKIFFCCSTVDQSRGLICTLPNSDNFFDNSDHPKFLLKDFINKSGNRIEDCFSFNFQLLYGFFFSTHKELLISGGSNSFSYWDLSTYFILPSINLEKHGKTMKQNQIRMTSGNLKTIKNKLLKKYEKYLSLFFSTNSEFIMKFFQSRHKKINFYQMIKYVFKNFYIFLITKDLRKNITSNRKKLFRDIIHFRNSNLNKSLENKYYFKMLLNNVANI